MRRIPSFFISLLLLFLTVQVSGAEYTLVEDGVPRCVIITGSDTLEAAKDFAYFCKRISGASIPVSANHGLLKHGSTRILLGEAAIREYSLAHEAAALPHGAYILKSKGKDLLIFGSNAKGSSNGVYGIIHDQLGIRFFSPDDLYTIIPESKTIKVCADNKKYIPSFPLRTFATRAPEVVKWLHRMRCSRRAYEKNEPFSNFGHNICNIVNPVKYASSHPDYYPILGNERFIPSVKDHDFWQPCYSNPALISLTVKEAVKFFKTPVFRFANSFEIAANDSVRWCECQRCRTLAGKLKIFDSYQIFSNLYFHFVNQVARGVREQLPDKEFYLGCLAYMCLKLPPDQELEPNVLVTITNDISQYFDLKYKENDYYVSDIWRKKNIKLAQYIYLTLGNVVPTYFPRTLASELKRLYQKGYVGVHDDGYSSYAWSGPMQYLALELLWNIQQDPDEILNEYFTKLYGPASGSVQKLFSLFEEIHMRPRKGSFLGDHNKIAQFVPFKHSDVKAINKLLAEAEAQSNSADISKRIRNLKEGLDLALKMIEAYTLANEIDSLDAKKNQKKILESVERIYSLIEERDAILKKGKNAGHYQINTAPQVHIVWKTYITRIASKKLAQCYSLPKTKANQKKFDDALKLLSKEEFSKVCYEILSGQCVLGKNLVKNSGFENKKSASSIYPTGPEWENSEADAWCFWRSVKGHGQRIGLSSANPYKGRYSAYASEITGSATFLGVVEPVEPGERYLYSVKTFRKTSSETSSKLETNVSVTWQDRNGKWIWQPTFSSRITGDNQWVTVETPCVVPAKAQKAVLFLSIKNVTGNDAVFFDEIEFRKISSSEKQKGIQK